MGKKPICSAKASFRRAFVDRLLEALRMVPPVLWRRLGANGRPKRPPY